MNNIMAWLMLCSLHVVHGAFRTGVNKTKWAIDSVLEAVHFPFDESPSKGHDYIKITGTDLLLSFCGHKLLEHKNVAEIILQIWPHIITYVTETIKKPKNEISW